jgi:hypothetical protein
MNNAFPAKASVRAASRALPDATPHLAEDVRALAAQFETALQAF